MSSPSSPLLDELPRWVKHRTRHIGVFSTSRVKLALVAGICIFMGYLLTSNFGDPAMSAVDSGVLYDSSSDTYADVLDGPPGYTADRSPAAQRHGLAPHTSGGSSIKGALSDLHHAVTDKFSSWRSPASGTSKNITHPGVFTDLSSHNSSAASNATAVAESVLAPGRDLLGERARIGKVTVIFGGAATYERAVRTHEAHDRIHGYPLHVLRHGILDDVWSKPAYILNLLLRELSRPEDERLQWLLWVDADTILLNPYVPVEVFLPPSPEFDDVHLLVTDDWNGLNNGVFPVRVNQWAVDLFAAIVSYRFYRPDTHLVFRDQSAMANLLEDPKFARHLVRAPQRWFNAYQGEHNETLAPFQVRRGDFLVHFAGVGDRDRRMAYWLDRVEQHLPDWEIEVQHTSYPGEAREFWAQQRGLRNEHAGRLREAEKAGRELIQDTGEQINEYRARLQEAEVRNMEEKQKKLRETMEREAGDAEAIRKATNELSEVRGHAYRWGLVLMRRLTGAQTARGHHDRRQQVAAQTRARSHLCGGEESAERAGPGGGRGGTARGKGGAPQERGAAAGVEQGGADPGH